MEQLVEQLFVEGVAHDAQWKFPSKQFIAPYDQERVLEALQIRFGPGTSLINQLPPDDSDPLKSAFYNVAENWFYQIFNREGYDALVVASSLLRWLRGDINTIVLCGGRLSTAKTAFNAIASCFPMAVIDGKINNLSSVAEIAPHAALYCLPFVDQKPDSLMLHLMEGNATTIRINGKNVHVPQIPMLIHCADLSLASEFSTRKSCTLFLTEDHNQTPSCYHPRRELKDFVTRASSRFCHMSLHCKRDNKLCNPCIRLSLEHSQ